MRRLSGRGLGPLRRAWSSSGDGLGGPLTRAWSSSGDGATAAVAAAWERVAALGRPGLAAAEALLEEAVRAHAAGPPTTATAALQETFATVAFLRGGRPAAAEAAAAAAVSTASAAGAPPAALALCRARHAACLVSLGRYEDAAALLRTQAGAADPTPEAAFFRALAQAAAEAAAGGGGGRAADAVPSALVTAVVSEPPPPAIAPLLEAAALRELRRAADGAVQAGDWRAARALAEGEVRSHEALAAARPGGARRPSDPHLHALYRWATLLHALGDAGAVPAAQAAHAAATAAWGPDDDRTVLRAHRLATARSAALVDNTGVDSDASSISAAASKALDRFRRRLGAGAGLAGEAAAAAAAATLVALSSSGQAADAFDAVLTPRKRREAQHALRAGLDVMRAAYGRDHVLTARMEGVAAAVLGGGGGGGSAG